jgi:hypothetical protein
MGIIEYFDRGKDGILGACNGFFGRLIEGSEQKLMAC